MRYTLRQLAYFVAAGEVGSILKASENIHVSQPSISNAISQLEDTFGVQLFIRHHAQGMSLTTAGRELFREAKQLLGDAERLQGIAGELSNQIIGTIELSSFTPVAPIVYAYPKEGVVGWFDSLVVPASANNVENARTFMNFMMDPVNMAMLTENQGYGDAIQGTAAYYSAELKAAPEVNPPSDLNVVFAPTCSPAAQSLIDKVWTKVLQ